MNRTLILSASLIALLLVGCKRLPVLPSTRSEPPVAVVVAEPNSGSVPLEIVVDTSGSSDLDGQIELRELSLNDGPYREIAELHPLTITTSGTHRLRLRVTDDRGAIGEAETTVIAREGIGSASGFQIETQYPSGRVGGREQQAFESAAERWSRLIVGELADTFVQAHQVEQACGSGYRYSGTIDDLLLFGDVQDIDGPGGIVGMAGACLIRSDGLPLVGLIILDAADTDFLASSRNLELVVLHELGHVLDMSLHGWQRRGLLVHDQPRCYDSRTVQYTGEAARSEFERLGGSGHVPVEDNGVMGTACSHWNEETFGTELMTGYLDSDSRLSRVTAAALADMGYSVDMDAADDYSLPGADSVHPLAGGPVLAEKLLPPGAVLDEQGELQPIPIEEPIELDLKFPGAD
ncbi:MAG: leishmanolysin-related zinc metalloendopeptidase [Trueperaceae bacterium]